MIFWSTESNVFRRLGSKLLVSWWRLVGVVCRGRNWISGCNARRRWRQARKGEQITKLWKGKCYPDERAITMNGFWMCYTVVSCCSAEIGWLCTCKDEGVKVERGRDEPKSILSVHNSIFFSAFIRLNSAQQSPLSTYKKSASEHPI
jgi:hypothetical protein